MKSLPQLSSQQWTLFTIAVFLLLTWLAWPFIGTIIAAVLGAWVFYPFYRRIDGRLHRPGASATVTLLFSAIVLVVPVAIVVGISVAQLVGLASELAGSQLVQGTELSHMLNSLVAYFNDMVRPVVGTDSISTSGIIEYIRTNVPAVLQGAARFALGAISNVPLAIILLIMYSTLFIELLVHGKKVIALIQDVSPLGKSTTMLYLKRIGLMANAMVKGQLLIAFIIAVISAWLLTFVGLSKYFFLMVVVFTLLNLVPLGSGIIIMPLLVVIILAGNVVPGLIVLALYMVVSNLDVVLRPRIIPKEIQLSAGLTMIAAFAGIAYFGLLGVVYGPVLMIVVVTSLQLLKQHRA